MDISLYSEFEAIVVYGSISEAAKNLHITQPALSRHMSTLEREFGLKLFDRTNPIQLTAAGEIFLEYACRISAEHARAVDRMTHLKHTPIRTVRVAGLYSPLIGRAARAVKHELETEALQIDIKQDEVICQQSTFDLLRSGMIEVAIEPFSPLVDTSDLASASLLREEVYIALATNNPLTEYETFTGADLEKIRFIFSRSNRHYAFYKHLQWLCKLNHTANNAPRSIMLSNTATGRDLFLRGLGEYATMLPYSMGLHFLGLADTAYVLRPFIGKGAHYDIRAFYKEDAKPETLQVIAALQNALREHAEMGKESAPPPAAQVADGRLKVTNW